MKIIKGYIKGFCNYLLDNKIIRGSYNKNSVLTGIPEYQFGFYIYEDDPTPPPEPIVIPEFNPNSIETVIYISLFTDKRASETDELPDLSDDPRGFWADAELGSHLWLLDRSKVINDVINDIKTYCYAALDWMVTDGIASKLDIRVYEYGVRPDIVVIEIDIYMPDMSKITHRYYYNWKLCVPEAFNGVE